MEPRSCSVCLDAVLSENSALKRASEQTSEQNSALLSENHGLKRASEQTSEQFPTLAEFCRRAKRIHSETTSGAFIKTDHEVATHEAMDLPECYVPPSFWECRTKTYRDFTEYISDEAMVNVLIQSLVQDIVNALGFRGIIDVQFDSPIIDTKLDISIVRTTNKSPMGAGEGKKPGKNCTIDPTQTDYDGTFQSNNTVSGELFDQLHLIRMHTYVDSIGIVATWNDWAMTSTLKVHKPVDKNGFEKIMEHFSKDKTKSGTTQPVTSDHPSNVWVRRAQCGDQKKQPDVAVRASTTKGKPCQNISPTKWRSNRKKGKMGAYCEALGG
jgi:hypothetical protein